MKFPFHDIRYWMFAHGLMLFVLRPIHTLAFGANEVSGPVDPPTYLSALVIGLVAFFSLLLVFFIANKTPQASRSPTLQGRSQEFAISPIRFLVCFVVWGIAFWFFNKNRLSEGLLSLLVADKYEFIHSNANYLSITLTLFVNFFLVMSFHLRLRRHPKRLLIFLMTIFCVLIGLTAGTKTLAILPFFIHLLRYSAKNDGLPLAVLIPALLVGMVAYVALDIFRHEGILGVLTISEDFRSNEMSFGFIEALLVRFYGTDILYRIVFVHVELEQPYLFGESIAAGAYFPIPRAVWPDKPLISFGKTVSDTYLADGFQGTSISAAPTMIGELFANFSFFAVPLYFIFVLLIYRHVSSLMGKSRLQHYSALYAPMAFPTLAFFQEASIVSWLIQLGVLMIVSFSLFSFSRKGVI